MPNKERYQSLVSALLYVAVCSRPDIAIAASIQGRKVCQPTEADWTEAKRTVQYLSATAYLKLHRGGTGGVSSMQTGLVTRWIANPTPGSCSSSAVVQSAWPQGSGTISLAARQQQCVSFSLTEAAYVVHSETSEELLWMLKLKHDADEEVVEPVVDATKAELPCIAGGSQRTKHIDTRFNVVKELMSTGVMEVRYCSDMFSDYKSAI